LTLPRGGRILNPVSDADLQLVTRIYEAFNATLELPRWALSDDVEWAPPNDEPDNGSRFGADAVSAYVREWASTFDDYRCELDELIDTGGSIVAAVRLHGRIGSAGQALSIPLAQVWTISDGLVVRVREFRTKEEALEQRSA
jgi:ketosteroid isomerase-like protein